VQALHELLAGPVAGVLEGLQSFLDQGGWVLSVLFVVTFVLWTLILERFWYLRITLPRFVAELTTRWRERTDRASWYAHQIRNMYVAEARRRAGSGMSMIQALTAICPLLGLLGTVTGMIEVFDVMAMAGNGNPRAMAEGVAKATIPTMAGMVAALSSVYFNARLGRLAKQQGTRAEAALELEVEHV